MPTKRLPWFKCWSGMTVDPKVAPLSDAVFRTWVELLDAASQQPHRGRFKDARSAAAIVRRPAAHVAALIQEALIDETPDGLTMHDWDQWQRWRQEDEDNTGSALELPPDQHRMDSRSAPDQLTNGHVIDASPLRAKTLDVKTLDVEDDKTGDVTPPAATQQPPRDAAPKFSDEERFKINSAVKILTPFGISTDPSLWRKVIDAYSAVDLEAEALKQADWLHRHKIKACSSARYLNWLDKARDHALDVGLTADCRCDEIRANLAINRNSSRTCPEHGMLQELPPIVQPSTRPRPPSAGSAA